MQKVKYFKKSRLSNWVEKRNLIRYYLPENHLKYIVQSSS